MGETVFDYSFTRPDPAGLVAAGGIGVVRYVPYRGDQGKGLTADELAALHAVGLGVALVFESTAGRALDGFAAGAFDADTVKAALSALNWPDDRPVYYAVDLDVHAGNYPAIREYFAGVCGAFDGADRVGIYGEYEICREIHGGGLAAWAWQCSAWSGMALYPGRHLYQIGRLNGSTVAGGTVDYNDAPIGDWGQYGGNDMAFLTQAEWENFKLRMLAGSERRDSTRAERLAIADAMIAEADTVQSVHDLAASAIVVAQGMADGSITPGMTPAEVEAIINRELSEARIVPNGGG